MCGRVHSKNTQRCAALHTGTAQFEELGHPHRAVPEYKQWSRIMNEKMKHNGNGKTKTAALCDQGISRWISRSGCKSADLLCAKWQDVPSPNAGYSEGKELLRLQKRKGRVGRQPRGNHRAHGRGPGLPVLQKLAKNNTRLNWDERTAVALLVAFQEVRTPASLQRTIDYTKAMTERLLREVRAANPTQKTIDLVGKDGKKNTVTLAEIEESQADLEKKNSFEKLRLAMGPAMDYINITGK
jgi:hypothetical protein